MNPVEAELRPLIVGEVLFDHFPDGRAVLGGAPFNVAWHLKGLGAEPVFVSRVGEDPEGRRVRQAMADWGLDTRWLQTDPRRPTGRVEVRLEGGQPRFEILPDQAYDHLDLAPLADSGLRPQALYHGSLLARRRETAAALLAVRRRLAAPVFVDVNLRPPWWSAQGVEALLRGSRWVKLNDDELAALEPSAGPDPDAAARSFRRRYGLDGVIVTRGAAGALWVEPEGVHQAPAAPVARLADTVGAGDAFSAVSLYGLMAGWDTRETLARALAFASRICEIQGAVTEDRDLYRSFRAQWS